MDSQAAQYRLMAWLSPSYPVGAFAYSHGIEWAFEQGTVRNETTLKDWMENLIRFGGGWSDAVLFCEAYRTEDIVGLNDYAIALAPSEERYLETTAQGRAFLKATLAAWPWQDSVGDPELTGDVAYPVAVAAAARGHRIDPTTALHAYLHAFAANLISAGVRLIPLGQSAGQRILAGLEQPITETAKRALIAGLDAVGGFGIHSDIAAMRHETQYTRLFRS